MYFFIFFFLYILNIYFSSVQIADNCGLIATGIRWILGRDVCSYKLNLDMSLLTEAEPSTLSALPMPALNAHSLAAKGRHLKNNYVSWNYYVNRICH